MYPDFLRTDVFFLMLVLASVFSVALLITSKKGSWFFLYYNFIGFFAVFLLFIALRPIDAGNDTAAYVNTYDALYSMSTAWTTGANYYGSQDLLFWPVVYLLKVCGVSKEAFILAVSMVSALLLWCSSLYYVSSLGLKRYYAPFFLFLAVQSYAIVYLGNHVRSSLALPFVIFFFSFLEKGRYLYGMIFLCLASSIHLSNIVFFPLLLIYCIYFRGVREVGRWHYAGVLAGACCFSVLASEVIPKISGVSSIYVQTKLAAYSEKVFEIESIYGAVTFWQLIFFALLFLWVGCDKKFAPYFYCLCVVIAISFLPKVAERYFIHALVISPPLIYVGLKRKFGEPIVKLALSSFYALLGALVITRTSVVYTLGISTFIRG